jgi:phosphatidylglycerophosphatase C
MGTLRHKDEGDGVRAGRPIVAFDFDGTLTVRDSFTAFLAWRIPKPRLVSGFLRLGPDIVRYGLDRNRERLKSASVAEWLAGTSEADLAAGAAAFAREVWDRFMRPDALAKWADWGERGVLRVIVTATPETIVQPFAERLGADQLIGTRLAFDAEGRATGALDGKNCRGPEKAARLREAFGEGVRLLAAYGDTSGDREMLELAVEKGYRVFRKQP